MPELTPCIREKALIRASLIDQGEAAVDAFVAQVRERATSVAASCGMIEVTTKVAYQLWIEDVMARRQLDVPIVYDWREVKGSPIMCVVEVRPILSDAPPAGVPAATAPASDPQSALPAPSSSPCP